MSTHLTVMTYNVRVGVESSLQALALAIIAAGRPDLIAFQEIGDRWNMGEPVDQTGTLASALGLPYAVFAGALLDPAGGRFGVSLAARWPLVDTSVEPLPRETDEQRVLLQATLQHPRGDIRVLNTHLSVAAPERLAQAARLGEVAQAAAGAGPVIVLGDLNDRPGTAVVERARGALTDCFDARGEGPEVTFSVKDPHRRIDYLFCGGGLRPTAPARVHREATASDHFPLSAQVGWP